jgi:flagellin
MVTNNSLTITAARIANFYTTNGAELAKNLVRIAAEKKFSRPSDNIPDYFRSSKITRENSAYKAIKQDLGEVIEMMNVAEKGGTFVFEDLLRMKSLVKTYYDSSTTSEEKSMIQADFNGVKDQITYTIANTKYDGKKLIQDTSATSPLRSVFLNPNDFTQTFDIDFESGDIADVSALDITAGQAAATAAVETQLQKAGAYLAKVSGYGYGLSAQYNLVGNKVLGNENAQSSISDIDNAEEITSMLRRSIQQQASVAMLSQANMARQSVLMLF